jgi:hypothetical protein
MALMGWGTVVLSLIYLALILGAYEMGKAEGKRSSRPMISTCKTCGHTPISHDGVIGCWQCQGDAAKHEYSEALE